MSGHAQLLALPFQPARAPQRPGSSQSRRSEGERRNGAGSTFPSFEGSRTQGFWRSRRCRYHPVVPAVDVTAVTLRIWLLSSYPLGCCAPNLRSGGDGSRREAAHPAPNLFGSPPPSSAAHSPAVKPLPAPGAHRSSPRAAGSFNFFDTLNSTAASGWKLRAAGVESS